MAEFTARVVKRTSIGFHPTVLPTVYDDALSYYEELNKILNSLNDAIDVIDENRALILQLDANIKEVDTRLSAEIKKVANDLTTLRTEYETFRDQVNTKITAIEKKNTEQDNRLTAVEKKNTEQDARLTAVENKNTSQDNEITSLKSRVTTLENNLKSVTTRVTALETNLSALTTRVSTAEGHITKLEGDVTRIDAEQTVQDNRIKALEESGGGGGGGGGGSQWGTVQVYQLWNNDASNGSLTNTHFIRHVDLQGNKYNILLNTGSCNSAVPLASLFSHKNFADVGKPEIDELIITSWDPAVCNAAMITALKKNRTIKHAWIPSSITWTNYTGADKETVKAVEAAVIAALHEGTNTEFSRMDDEGKTIKVGAISFNCLYDPTEYGVTSTNMLCRIHCNSDMVVTGMADITRVIANNRAIRNWLPNMKVIDAPSNEWFEPAFTLGKMAKNIFTHISFNQANTVPVDYAKYMGIQWCNTAGGENSDGYSSMVNLSGSVPRLTPTSNTVYVPEIGG